VSGTVDTVTTIPVNSWCKKQSTLTNRPISNWCQEQLTLSLLFLSTAGVRNSQHSPIGLSATGVEARIQQQHLKILNLKESFLNNIKIGAMLGTCHFVHRFAIRQL